MAIVCATHFTPSSTDALQVATLLARRTKQRLYLVSVLPGVALSAHGAKESETNSALALEASVLRDSGLEVETVVLHGQLERALGQLCTDVSAQLLVVGDTSHTRSSLFATPVDRIAEGVSVPVLVVRSAKPFVPWARGDQPLKVLLAIDHSWSSALARDWLTKLAGYGALDVLATHIWSPDEEAARHGRTSPPSDEEKESMAARLLQDAQAGLRGMPANVQARVQLEVGRGHVGELLLSLAARERVDMMVLGTHPHRGVLGRLTSVTHEVLVNGLMSVALIPDDVRMHPKAVEPPRQSHTY